MENLLDPSNRLFVLARMGRRLPHLVVAVILSFAFVLIAQFVGGIPALIINLALSAGGELPATQDAEGITSLLLPDTALEQVIFLVLIFAPIFLLLWAWLAFYEKRPFWTLGLERAGAAWKYLRGLLVGLLMFAASIGILALFGFIAIEDNPQQGLAALGGVLFVFLGWTVQGPAEEAIARGWLMPVIGARYKPLWGVLISSVVFAIYHSLNPNLNLLAILNLFLFGFFTALYALYEGGLWGVFSIHAVWNWAQGNLFGLAVSGQEPVGGMLFDLMETGPDVLTGGGFGPEGGIAVTIVLLVSSALVWLVSRRRVSTGQVAP